MSSTRMTITLGREEAARLTAAYPNGKVTRDRRVMRAAAGAVGMDIPAYRTWPQRVKKLYANVKTSLLEGSSREKRIVLPLVGDRSGRAVPWNYPRLIWQGQQLGVDGSKDLAGVPAGQIRPAD